ncbi:MAG: hypothetical protein HY270_21530 [Deltaproteobacteria bacterium]|nr:hypothetical protein [Deltaproteobacteria bacterium]
MGEIRGLLVACLLLAVALVICFNGCGGNDLVVGGHIPLTPTSTGPTATPGCLDSGQSCTRSVDCCSAVCDPGSLTCN